MIGHGRGHQLPAHLCRHPQDVFHQRLGITEHVMVDALENVANPRSGDTEGGGERVVDVAAAVRHRIAQRAENLELFHQRGCETR